MKKTTTTLCAAILVMLALASCKKSSSDTSSAPVFKADTVFTVLQANAFPNYDGWNSIAIDGPGNKIFFNYTNPTDGFRIDLFDVVSGTSSIIYKHFPQSGQTVWHQSNGSEGMRLRYFSNTFDGNKLFVPGGATNRIGVEIKVNSDYSTTFQRIDSIPQNSNGMRVESVYDADLVKSSTSNLINIVSMWNDVYNLNKVYTAYAVSPTSHGSSIVGTPGGLEYVFCGDNKTLELYNNGVFIRAISFTSGESQLQMDSQNRIYLYNGSTIYRFSSDLTKREEFPIKGNLSGFRMSALVIKETASYIQAYSFSGKNLIGMKLPL